VTRPVEDDPTPCPGTCDRAGSPVWCGPCKKLARACLNDIDRLIIWLEQEADGFSSRSPGTYTISGGSEEHSPSPTVDLLDSVYMDLSRFEAAWRREQGYSPTRRSSLGRTAFDRSMTIAFLQKNLISIMLTPKMSDHLRRVMRWRVVLQHLAHAQAEPVERPGRCPRCHLVNVLYTDQIMNIIKCRSCPLDMTEEEYAVEVLETADSLVIAESRRNKGLPT
jgi:hypothetical protein